jgi:ATP phosphoribosyltransferase
MIRLGLPKGRMASDSDRLCGALGIKVRAGVLSYRGMVESRPVCVYLMKAPDVARLLSKNLLDLGLTGDEWLLEAGVSPDRRCFEARSYEASVCLLMARGDHRPPSHIRSVATPYPNVARSLLRGVAPGAEILAVSGSTEALVPDMADACVEVVETGASAALNALVIHLTFGYVTTHLVRSERCDATDVAPVVELLASTTDVVR